MKKLTTLTVVLAALITPSAAHAGLYHAYKGIPVTLLIILLWITVTVYEELGDTWTGHWALFSGVFLAFYVPLFHPHSPVTGSATGMGVIAAAVLLIGGATYIRHRHAQGEAEDAA